LIKYKNILVIGSIIILLSAILIYLSYNEVYSIRLEHEFSYSGVYGDIPVKIITLDDQVYVLSSTSGDSIAVYKLDSRGQLNWRITWEEKKLIPLALEYQSNSLIVMALVNERHGCIIRTYNPINGALIDNKTISLSSIYWIFAGKYSSKYVILGGARYVAGLKLQNFIVLINYINGRLIWQKIWGSKDVDSVIFLSPISSGIVYLSTSNTDVYVGLISYNGNIVWNHTLGKIRIIGAKVINNNVYVLAFRTAPIIYDIDLDRGGIITYNLYFLTTEYSKLNITSFDIDKNGTVAIAGYYGITPVKGIVFLTSITQLGKEHVLTRIQLVSSHGGNVAITAVRLVGSKLYVGGTDMGTFFLVEYSYVKSGNWLMILLPIASLIAGIILVSISLYKMRKT